MDIFSLRCFVEVARRGSFSKAADLLFRTQPAVSVQVQKLEEELKQPLFDRSHRTPKLTDAGRTLFAEAQQVLERLDGLSNLLGAATAMAGTVVIASNASLIDSSLPRPISSFHERFPAVALQLKNLTGRGIVRAVHEGTADIGIGFLLERHPDIVAFPLAQSKLVLVCPPKSAMARGQRPSAAAILAGPLVHFEEGVDLRRHVELALAGRSRFRPVLELPTIESILRYVQLGIGCSILPDFALSKRWRTLLAVRPLGHSVPAIEIAAVVHRRRQPSRAAAEFLRAILPVAPHPRPVLHSMKLPSHRKRT